MVLATSPARSFCATCGWPLGGSRCDACGGDAVPLPLQDAGRFVPKEPHASTLPGMDKAAEAWRQQDYPRAVSYVIGALGLTSRSVSGQDAPAWILIDRKTPLFLSLSSYVTLESPLCKLPQRQRVPALRFALEASAGDHGASRICLRGDLLVLRLAARVAALTPALLASVIRDAAGLAERFAEELTVAFDARPAIAEADLARVGWEAIGAPRMLPPLALAESLRSAPPPPSSTQASTPRPGVGRSDSIPPILAPSFAAGVAQSAPSLGAPGVPRGGDLTAGRPSSQSGPFSATPNPQFSKRRPTLNEIHVEGLSKRASIPPPVPELTTDADRFCDLLRHAQSLATVVSFHERPATMMLLVRATVYRSLYMFGDTAPDAVAHLYRATAASTKEIWQAHPEGRRRSSMSIAIPMAEPALLVMERIVSSRGAVPKEKPPTIEPLTTAAQAKEHLARYLDEIERAPVEAPLTHFLALGALTELLVRTKLPQQTGDRLRDIVAHAQRDGAKPATIELMMTALRRITAG